MSNPATDRTVALPASPTSTQSSAATIPRYIQHPTQTDRSSRRLSAMWGKITKSTPKRIPTQYADAEYERVNLVIHARVLRAKRDGLCEVCARLEWICSRSLTRDTRYAESTEGHMNNTDVYPLEFLPWVSRQTRQLSEPKQWTRALQNGFEQGCILCTRLAALYTDMFRMSDPISAFRLRVAWKKALFIQNEESHHCRTVSHTGTIGSLLEMKLSSLSTM